LVSANAATTNNPKLMICGNGPWKMVQRGMNPKIVAALRVDELPEAERVEHQQRRGDRQRHRQLIADHLRRAAQAAQQRIFVVRRPSGQRDAVNSHAGQAKDEQDADVQIGQLHRRF
jgi:hypothetical protein